MEIGADKIVYTLSKKTVESVDSHLNNLERIASHAMIPPHSDREQGVECSGGLPSRIKIHEQLARVGNKLIIDICATTYCPNLDCPTPNRQFVIFEWQPEWKTPGYIE